MIDKDNDKNTATKIETGVLVAAGETSHTELASTPVELARLGMNEIAYIHPAVINGAQMWAIFSAAGDPIGAAESFDQAWAAVREHNMEPLRVH